jgi:hypothetical protein
MNTAVTRAVVFQFDFIVGSGELATPWCETFSSPLRAA